MGSGRFGTYVHTNSKKALAGMIQRWKRDGRLKEGLLAMPSDRALISLEPMRGSFAQAGTSPQRIAERTRSACSATTCYVGRTSPAAPACVSG